MKTAIGGDFIMKRLCDLKRSKKSVNNWTGVYRDDLWAVGIWNSEKCFVVYCLTHNKNYADAIRKAMNRGFVWG